MGFLDDGQSSYSLVLPPCARFSKSQLSLASHAFELGLELGNIHAIPRFFV